MLCNPLERGWLAPPLRVTALTWADIPVPKFTNVRMPEMSACQRKARELEASDLESSLDEVDVDRIVAAVLRGEAALTPREFRFATALIFDSGLRNTTHNLQRD